uniref:Type 4a pilus biogenesis protein PilO n=1 Tax=candidate division WOR-3 bacterium TaxID=2052148 RepID=A0A7C4CBH1_UNCW3
MGLIERRVLLIGLAVYILLAVVAWFALYQPRLQARRQAVAEVSDLKEQIKSTQDRISQMPRLRQQKEDLESSISGMWQRVVPRSEMLLMLRRLAEVAAQRRVRFLEIAPPGLDTLLQEESPTAQVRPIPFLVTSQGRYVDIGRYVENLEEFPYFVRIPDFEIRARDDLRPEVEAKLLVNIYASSLAGGGRL